MMLYILFSFLIASLFAIFTNGYFDAKTLLPPTWVESGYWAIMGAGVFLAFLDIVRNQLCCLTQTKNKLLCHGTQCPDNRP
jgi:ABC-type antimicrobial peptide transport system permease subunit